MAYIQTIDEKDARGLLKREYVSAAKRAGRVFNILKIMSLNAEVLQASMRFYLKLMFGPSPLSRAQREMLAVVTSAANGCFY